MKSHPLTFAAALAVCLAPHAAAAPITSHAVFVQAGKSNMEGNEAPTAPTTEEGEAVPGQDVNLIGSVFLSECPAGKVVVGVRTMRGKSLSGVAAICAKLERTGAGFEWGSKPAPVNGPPQPPPPPMITRTVQHKIRAEIGRNTPDGFEVRAAATFAEVATETLPDPDFPVPPPVVTFAAGKVRDQLCAPGEYVRGVRFVTTGQGITQLELSCGVARGDAKLVAVFGVSDKAKTAAKSATPAAATGSQRVDCRGSASNPNDGVAANAVFGNLDGGQVQSIGINCAAAVDPFSAFHTVAATVEETALGFGHMFGFSQTFDAPALADGRPLGAACAKGGENGECGALAAADFCDSKGFDFAAAYAVGTADAAAVLPDGTAPKKRTLRGFESISCGESGPSLQLAAL